jgi:hypothetical protein
MPKKKVQPSAEALVQKICAMLERKDTGKAAYGEADRLLQELVPQLKLDQVVDLGNGETAQLIDNFAQKNKHWKPCGINRYDVKVSRAVRPKVKPSEALKPASGPEPSQHRDTITSTLPA